MREFDPLDHEKRFFEAVSRRVDDLEDWYHADHDGTPWMIVSYDFLGEETVRKGLFQRVKKRFIVGTLRCDWDGARLLGGWSTAYLNWDDGVRAQDAHIDTSPPDGLEAEVTNPEEAASIAADWFEAHLARKQPTAGGGNPTV